MKQIALIIALATALSTGQAQADVMLLPAATIVAPIPPAVAVGVVIARELFHPKPFCNVLRVFNRKKRCKK